MMLVPTCRQSAFWHLPWQLLLFLAAAHMVLPCNLPAHLRNVDAWSSQIEEWGEDTSRQHKFDAHWMNVSIKSPEPLMHHLECHKAVGNDTFIFREVKNDSETLYKCVKFDIWSPYVIQLWESPFETKAFRSLCARTKLVPDQWPLIWHNFDFGYVPCPEIGGYDMEVLNSQNRSYCDYIDPVPKPRLESECIQGEGLRLDFKLNQCKGYSIPLGRSLTANLYCLGQRKIGGYTHFIARDNALDPKTMMFRYSKLNTTIDMYLFGDIIIESESVIQRDSAHIRLTRTVYDSLCADHHHNCLAPETCDISNLINCQTTCRNYTTCFANKTPCNFVNSTLGDWREQGSSGSQVLSIDSTSATLDRQGTFQCLNIYSSTTTGRKPVVKIMTNGCKPRYACLDVEAYSPSILRYRLSESRMWPYKQNIVRGDLCGQTTFIDAPPPGGSHFQNRYAKMLIRASNTKPGRSSRRSTVQCNLQSAISFRVNPSCTGTLRSCQSGDSMVMTFGWGCEHVRSRRVFYRCLASFRNRIQDYTITEQTDDPSQLHCWIRKVDSTGIYPSILLKMHAGDCTNGTLIFADVVNAEYITKFEYSGEGQDRNRDSCLDIPAPTPPTSSTVITKQTEATLSPTIYKNTNGSTTPTNTAPGDEQTSSTTDSKDTKTALSSPMPSSLPSIPSSEAPKSSSTIYYPPTEESEMSSLTPKSISTDSEDTRTSLPSSVPSKLPSVSSVVSSTATVSGQQINVSASTTNSALIPQSESTSTASRQTTTPNVNITEIKRTTSTIYSSSYSIFRTSSLSASSTTSSSPPDSSLNNQQTSTQSVPTHLTSPSQSNHTSIPESKNLTNPQTIASSESPSFESSTLGAKTMAPEVSRTTKATSTSISTQQGTADNFSLSMAADSVTTTQTLQTQNNSTVINGLGSTTEEPSFVKPTKSTDKGKNSVQSLDAAQASVYANSAGDIYCLFSCWYISLICAFFILAGRCGISI